MNKQFLTEQKLFDLHDAVVSCAFTNDVKVTQVCWPFNFFVTFVYSFLAPIDLRRHMCKTKNNCLRPMSRQMEIISISSDSSSSEEEIFVAKKMLLEPPPYDSEESTSKSEKRPAVAVNQEAEKEEEKEKEKSKDSEEEKEKASESKAPAIKTKQSPSGRAGLTVHKSCGSRPDTFSFQWERHRRFSQRTQNARSVREGRFTWLQCWNI